MKKLLLLTFLLAPMSSLAGDYAPVANAEAIYKSLNVAELIAHQEDGTTLFYKNAGNYFCTRIVSLDLPQVEKYECNYLSDADLAR